VSSSVYETGRLVTLVPWLTGHASRVRYLLETQRQDGGWGAPDDGYALVPTLSATEAILSVQGSRDPDIDRGVDHALVRAARRGLEMLFRWLSGDGPAVPDLPAVELTVPHLIALINRHLAVSEDSDSGSAGNGLEPWLGRCLRPPAGMDDAKLTMIRAMLESGQSVPRKVLHALEVAGDTARGHRDVRTESTGTVGASPAATAAWLGDRGPAEPGDAARWHLETVTALQGGPVPCGYPLTVFERAWVLSWLVRVGIPVTVHPQLVLSLTAPLGPAGTPAAAGLPEDADTTAGALYALSLLGAYHRPDPLWEYETPSHFCTWQGEDGFSTTTNAHVIEAFGQYLNGMGRGRIGRDTARRYVATIEKVAGWLREQQRADGSWTDRWHASPYYATACCALALRRFGGEPSAAAVDRARQWALATQRPDGSWGRWCGTSEETAYAIHILLNSPSDPDEVCLRAVARGRAHLLRSITPTGDDDSNDLPLWHDKDLYRPAAIVRAAVLAALYLTETCAFTTGG
jgi:halimadienyl-diphosphate synthase